MIACPEACPEEAEDDPALIAVALGNVARACAQYAVCRSSSQSRRIVRADGWE
jgi:hypothetical protein